MTETPGPYGLAFPDTRLTSERLWCSSALSVLKTRQGGYAEDSMIYARYAACITTLMHLETRLHLETLEEATTDG